MSLDRHLTQSLAIFTVGKNQKFRAVTDQDRMEPVAPAEGAGQTPGQQPTSPPGQGSMEPGQPGSQTQAPAAGQNLEPLPSEPRGPVMPSGTQYPRESKPAASQ